MADEVAQALAAHQAAVADQARLRMQTNDPGKLAGAQRGVDAALARYTAVRANAAAPAAAGAKTAPKSSAPTILGIPLY
jgi:hypothetical protein